MKAITYPLVLGLAGLAPLVACSRTPRDLLLADLQSEFGRAVVSAGTLSRPDHLVVGRMGDEPGPALITTSPALD